MVTPSDLIPHICIKQSKQTITAIGKLVHGNFLHRYVLIIIKDNQHIGETDRHFFLPNT